ncbi:MAG: phosphatase PAP2 family protein [Bacteroides sp.]|nr:phosphatase PAP2 family protein [Bacteroides sp.]
MTELLQWLTELDNQILLTVNGWHSPFFDYFMKAYSGKVVWVPMYAAILYVIVRNFHWRTSLFCMIAVALTITFADQMGATVIRPLVERLRPANPDNPISEMVHIVDGYRGGRYGFPSCHAANTFGLAFFILFLFRKRWLSCYMMIWAALTSYSRMYLGVHYLGDLLAGMLLGALGAWLMYQLFVRVSRYERPSLVSRLYLPVHVGILTMLSMAIYAALRLIL